MTKITESTLIPVSLVVVIIGGVFWLSTLHANVKASQDTIVSIESKQDKLDDILSSIDRRLATIEGMLKNKKD